MTAHTYTLKIGWLYPELMSTYGDRGNMVVLQKRAQWRSISVQVIPINQASHIHDLESLDLIFGGGAQDREQEIVMRDLKGEKGVILKSLIEQDIPALFVCGSPQLMGKWYEPAFGERIEGLGIFDMYTVHPGKNAPRLIGNTVGEIYWENLHNLPQNKSRNRIVGFENHGGRTTLGSGVKPFAKVIKGFGNNGEDGQEGVVYKNAIGCYYHGPLLPKNPLVADWLIATALRQKYHKEIPLQPLDDTLELKAQQTIAKRLGVAV